MVLRVLFGERKKIADMPFHGEVRTESVYYLSRHQALRIPAPPTMKNHHNYVASLSQLGRWLRFRCPTPHRSPSPRGRRASIRPGPFVRGVPPRRRHRPASGSRWNARGRRRHAGRRTTRPLPAARRPPALRLPRGCLTLGFAPVRGRVEERHDGLPPRRSTSTSDGGVITSAVPRVAAARAQRTRRATIAGARAPRTSHGAPGEDERAVRKVVERRARGGADRGCRVDRSAWSCASIASAPTWPGCSSARSRGDGRSPPGGRARTAGARRRARWRRRGRTAR